MKVKIAYIEEPPFGWTGADHSAEGADIELAETVLRAIGVTEIEHRLTTFAELLPGLEERRWDMSVPLFVTPQRMNRVNFSLPVWAIGDGFLVRAGNPMQLNSYDLAAQCNDARLGIIVDQVQLQAAQKAGVRDDQIALFDQQADAIEALLAGKIDAYASTALGNRILVDRIGHELVDAVPHSPASIDNNAIPKGAFSFKQGSHELLNAFNRQLRIYLGSADHRRRMSRYGLTEHEIDPVVPVTAEDLDVEDSDMNSNEYAASKLFEPEPPQWGLRGDPYLWHEMRHALEDRPMPESVECLTSTICDLYLELTGFALTRREPFYVPRFAHGGMSSGVVSPEFWSEQVLPILHQRLEYHRSIKRSGTKKDSE